MVEDFFRDIDRRWNLPAQERITLKVIGSTALMLRASYVRGTKDSDVVRTGEVTEAVAERLIALAGPSTDLHKRHRLYIQLVHGGILFRRQRVGWHMMDALNDDLRHFRIEVMDVVDVIVSKLKRLHQDDLDDVEAMVERGLVTHEALVDCFREAVDFTTDAKAEDLPRFRANLHRVERDVFGMNDPTEIELPSWVEDD